ncbi:hypothetical protein CPC08DRAFT_42930 [Agrocybe pediades]|nr:hypothetical protein CPC08DRAFT_42930 [Agrocybe pediades]
MVTASAILQSFVPTLNVEPACSISPFFTLQQLFATGIRPKTSAHNYWKYMYCRMSSFFLITLLRIWANQHGYSEETKMRVCGFEGAGLCSWSLLPLLLKRHVLAFRIEQTEISMKGFELSPDFQGCPEVL